MRKLIHDEIIFYLDYLGYVKYISGADKCKINEDTKSGGTEEKNTLE